MILTSADVREIIDGQRADGSVDVDDLLAWIIDAPTTDEDYQTGQDAVMAAIGLYAYCAHYHGGMDSAEYRVLCTLTRPGLFSPGHNADTLHPDEDRDAINVYRALGGTFDESEDAA